MEIDYDYEFRLHRGVNYPDSLKENTGSMEDIKTFIELAYKHWIINDGKSHYAIVKVSLVLNKKSDNYGTYNQEFLANQDETIKNDVIQVIGQYTLDEFEANKEQVKSEILSDMQKLFGADLVIGVNFSESTSE